MFLTDVMTYLMKGTLTNLKGVLKGDGKTLSELAVDSVPTANSENLVTSGGVKSALNDAPKGNEWTVSASGTLKLKFSLQDMAMVFSSSGMQTNLYCATSGLTLSQIASATGISVNIDPQSNDILVIENTNTSARRIIILQINGLLPTVV